VFGVNAALWITERVLSLEKAIQIVPPGGEVGYLELIEGSKRKFASPGARLCQSSK
jgi:hypothetical protein